MSSQSDPAANAPSQPESTPTSAEAEVALLREENQHLKDRVAWFERQLFGRKSEKRIIDAPDQINLLGEPTQTLSEPEDSVTVSSFKRGKAKKQRPDDCATDAGLRFSEDVPVEVIAVLPPELSGPDADQYDIIDTYITFKLAQQSASYVVLRYEMPVFKHKADQSMQTAALPDQVLERSIADVSLLVGLLVDKFQYHLPLYRQHQRMAQQGITVARSSLTNWVKRSIELLRPIVEAQCRHILLSRVLAMDETRVNFKCKTTHFQYYSRKPLFLSRIVGIQCRM